MPALPPGIARLVDDTVERFAGEHGLDATIRWYDADLWMVTGDESTVVSDARGREVPGLLQRRITIGTAPSQWSLLPDLFVMPDAIIHTTRMRLRMASERRRALSEEIDVLRALRATSGSPSAAAQAELATTVLQYLERGWRKALAIDAAEVRVPLV